MRTVAADTEKLRELAEDTTRAWADYRERTHELTGEAYDETELEAWNELQIELGRLERRRRLMEAPAAA